LISFIFQGSDVIIAEKYPSSFNALKWLAQTDFNWTSSLQDFAQTDAFTFHQLLHHKRNLLKDEEELLKSAKFIVVRYIAFLLIQVQHFLKIPVLDEWKVKLNIITNTALFKLANSMILPYIFCKSELLV
jgi:hypothetical protein